MSTEQTVPWKSPNSVIDTAASRSLSYNKANYNSMISLQAQQYHLDFAKAMPRANHLLLLQKQARIPLKLKNKSRISKVDSFPNLIQPHQLTTHTELEKPSRNSSLSPSKYSSNCTSLPKINLGPLHRSAIPDIHTSNTENSVEYTPFQQNRRRILNRSIQGTNTNKSPTIYPEIKPRELSKHQDFFSVNVLGRNKRIRNLSDMYANLKKRPTPRTLANSVTNETDYTIETPSVLDVSKNSSTNGEPSNIHLHPPLEILKEEPSPIIKIPSVARQQPELLCFTNNIYKQRAMLKQNTLSQIRSDVRNQRRSIGAGKIKEMELSPILQVRKRLDRH